MATLCKETHDRVHEQIVRVLRLLFTRLTADKAGETCIRECVEDFIKDLMHLSGCWDYPVVDSFIKCASVALVGASLCGMFV